VEDEVLIAMDEAQTIKKHGYEVITAHTGEKAIEMVEQDPDISLILMDIDLGKGIDGTQAAKAILEKHEIPIVFLTSHTEREYVDKVKQITRYGYVLKNSGEFVLIESINMAFELFQAHVKLEKEKETSKQNEEKFRLVTESIKDLFWMSTQGIGEMIYISPLFDSLWEKPKEELYQSPKVFLDKIHPDDRDRYLKTIDIYHRNGKSYECEYRIIKNNGDIVWINERGFPVPQTINDKNLMAGVCTDITERKNTEKTMNILNEELTVQNEELVTQNEEYLSLNDKLQKTNIELIEAKERIQKSEEQYLSLLNRIQAGVVVHAADTQIVASNPKAQELLGLSEDQMLGKTVIDPDWRFIDAEGNRMPLEDYPVNQVLTKQRALKDFTVGIYRPYTMDVIWVLVNAVPVLDDSGKIEQVIVTFMDITERKKSNEALKKAEKLYRNIFMNAQVGLYRTDIKTGKMLEANDALAHFIGYNNREELLADDYNIAEHYVNPEDRQKMIKLITEKGEIQNYEAPFSALDGSVKWIRFSAKITPDKKSIEGVSEDFTEEKTVKDALKESEERFRNLTELLPEAVIETDKDLNITYANNQAFLLMGYTKEDFNKGLNGLDMFIREEHEKVKENIKQRISGEISGSMEYFAVKKNGEIIPVLINADPIMKEGKSHGLRVIIVDISERKRIQQVQEKYLKQLEFLNQVIITISRMKDVDEICSFIADKIQSIYEKAVVAVSLYDKTVDSIRIRAVSGFSRFANKVIKLIGFDPTKILIDRDKMISDVRLYTSGKLEHMTDGIYGILEGKIPKPICHQIERFSGLKDVYTVGFALNNEPLGGITLILPEKQDIIIKSAVETIASNVSLLFERISAEESLKIKEKNLQKSLEEKDFLMKELNHRVKNNLSIISSLIRLKNTEIGNGVDLSDIHHQIDAIRLVHEKLYNTEKITNLSLKDYIQDLLNTIFSSFTNQYVTIENKIEDIDIEIKQAISIGLIINEIATNTVKYGFDEDQKIKFITEMKEDQSKNQYILILTNTGKPFPEDIDLYNPRTLGLRLISSLARQLDGTIELRKSPYPKYTIKLPISKNRDA
jgi:PAS domain S-box-containing protein